MQSYNHSTQATILITLCWKNIIEARNLLSLFKIKSPHWLKLPERIHFKVLSLTYCLLQYSQPTHLCELFTIQPTRSTRSSSCLTLSRPLVTAHLMFSNLAISTAAPRLWNNLPPQLRTSTLPPPPSLQITRHHLHPAPLSVTPYLS